MLARAVVAGYLLAIHRRAFAIRAARVGRKADPIGAKRVPVRAAELFQIANAGTTGAIATLRWSDTASRTAEFARRAIALRAIPNLIPRAARWGCRCSWPARRFGI